VLRNSLYVLPASQETREDFDWVRQEIMTSGGQVSVLEAAAVDGMTDDELVRQFRALRTVEYEDLAAEIRNTASRVAKLRRRTSPTGRQRWLRTVRERFGAIQARDYFGAAGRALVEQALKEVENSGPPAARESAHVGRLHAADFRGRTWVTRPRPGVDRFACAWLIRRFIAADAKFAFQDDAALLRKGQIPFDMPDVEFGHHGTRCSLETLMERFGVSDGGVRALSKVVHDLDLKESRFAMAETPAVGRLVEGLRASYSDDAELLEHGIVVMEALYRSFASDHGVRRKRAR
jgi:hypothetical protein